MSVVERASAVLGADTDRDARPAPVRPSFWQRHRVKIPGMLVCFTIAAFAQLVSETVLVLLWGSPIRGLSAVTVAAAIGLLCPAAIKDRALLKPGYDFCIRHILRLSIVLVGLRLSFTDVLRIGIEGLPVIVACIATSIGTAWLMSRRGGVPLRLALLIGAGTSICGISAVMSLGPALKAKEDEMSYGVTVITIFGFLALFCYPLIAAHAFPGDSHLAGLFLGTAIHDTAQVAGASVMYEQSYNALHVLDVAAVVKLFRNLFIVAVIPIACMLHRRISDEDVGAGKHWSAYVPGFIIGFLAMSLLRTLGDWNQQAAFGFIPLRTFWDTIEFSEIFSTQAMAISMAAAGMNTSIGRLRRIGLKPLAAGLVSAVVVGMMSYAAIRLTH
jgi:uncharacterized integral membrane protein (TIGR00698 family)